MQIQNMEWIAGAAFTAIGGFTFMCLLAGVRRALVAKIQAENLAREAAEKERKWREEHAIPEVGGLG